MDYRTISIVVIAVIGLWFVYAYNSLVKKRAMTEEAWSGIEVQLKRRHDLVPNLVNTVKAYGAHESAVFQKVTEARAASLGANTVMDQAKAENDLTRALRGLFAVAEAYPDLKANSNYMELQQALGSLEDEIQLSRRYYNGAARNLNIGVQTFPTVIAAKLFHFKKAEFFELEDQGESQVPKVEF